MQDRIIFFRRLMRRMTTGKHMTTAVSRLVREPNSKRLTQSIGNDIEDDRSLLEVEIALEGAALGTMPQSIFKRSKNAFVVHQSNVGCSTCNGDEQHDVPEHKVRGDLGS